ncbi:hypothetical protein [Paracoccus sp. S-4012]|uniref:TlpA family protein disulfide reductase n=1 Tax=Paracoccus sp. S-4012 TaxID=2665648 RepID=UPI0018A22CBC|nr:hypothetical protein [Paracoccus sp. S-4012]
MIHDDDHPGQVPTEARARVHLPRLARGVALVMGLGAALPAVAQVDDGSFPTADQVGGEVFPAGLQPGDEFPMDVRLYDLDGKEVTLGDVAAGKRTLLTFFISAAPVSVAELSKIEDFADGKDINLVFANSDVVGTGLLGGSDAQIPETVRTVNIIKVEEQLDTPMYVAPNNVFIPEGLSNRLGFRGLPTSYVIDDGGRVVATYVGPREWTEGDLMGDAPRAEVSSESPAGSPGATADPNVTPAAAGETPPSDEPTVNIGAPAADVAPITGGTDPNAAIQANQGN